MVFPNSEQGNISDIKYEYYEDDIVLREGTARFDGISFIEPFYKRERLIILGAGHISVQLSMLAKMTGFYVVVVDDRAEFANKERFHFADEVICLDFDLAIKKIKPEKNDYIVIVTREHINDISCVEALLKFDEPLYVGMLGSKKRVSKAFENLKKRGLDSERLKRISNPIGLDIGAKNIEEIDISIMAEIIKRRRSDLVQYIDRCDHDYQSIFDISKIERPCAIATIIYDEGSTPRDAGASMAIFKDGTIIGSIGGGSIEGKIIDKGKEIIGTGRYEIVYVALDGSNGMGEGMICGGKVGVLIEDYKI